MCVLLILLVFIYGINSSRVLKPNNKAKRIPRHALVAMADHETCCGFEGILSVKFDAIYTALADQKLKNANGYWHHPYYVHLPQLPDAVDAVIKNKQLPLQTIPIADVLASSWQ